MSRTTRLIAPMFTRTGMLVFLLLALISCGTGTTSGGSASDTTAETTIAPPPEETISAASSNDEVFFPQQPEGVDYPMADNRGRLILDSEGCIRLEESDGDFSPTLLWPANFDLRVGGEDIGILDRRGRLAGRIGEKVRIGGG